MPLIPYEKSVPPTLRSSNNYETLQVGTLKIDNKIIVWEEFHFQIFHNKLILMF